MIGVRLKVAHKFFLHMEISSTNGQTWALTAVYVSPKTNVRQFLWNKLDELNEGVPWVLIGYFNCVLLVEERSSMSGVSSSFWS